MTPTRKATQDPHEARKFTINEADELLDIHEAAKLLALKPATLRRWTFTRRVPFVKLGLRSVRYRRADLEKFIADGAKPALRPVNGR